MPIQTSPLSSWRIFGRGKQVGVQYHPTTYKVLKYGRAIGYRDCCTLLKLRLFSFVLNRQAKASKRPDMFFSVCLKKNTARQGSCQGNLCNAQMPAHETMLCFPSAPSMPAGILTPNPSLRTQVGLQDGALKTMVWPSAQKRLPARKEGRKHLRWRIIPFEMWDSQEKIAERFLCSLRYQRDVADHWS